MANAKRIKMCVEEILPPEILEKILKYLDFPSLSKSKKICRRWKRIIERFEEKLGMYWTDLCGFVRI